MTLQWIVCELIGDIVLSTSARKVWKIRELQLIKVIFCQLYRVNDRQNIAEMFEYEEANGLHDVFLNRHAVSNEKLN